MPPPLKRLVAPLLALLLAASPLAAQEVNPNVRFGLPSPAKPDPRQREDYLIARPQYVLSYNAETRTPNWVCWRLRKDDIGSAARAPFEPDPDLPPAMAKVTARVYDGSGFDRGHMCNAHDRSRSAEDIRATFYMTNIVPQSPASNQRGWEKREDYCRFGADAYRGDLQDLRNALVRALQTVREKTGRVLLLVDALDELVAGDGEKAHISRRRACACKPYRMHG